MVMAGVREYRLVMRHAANLGTLEAWYDHMDAGAGHGMGAHRGRRKTARQEGREAGSEGCRQGEDPRPLNVFAKRADEIDGKLRIVPDPPLIVPIDELSRTA